MTPSLSPIARALEAVAFYGLLAVVVLSAAPYGSVEVWWASAVEVSIFALAALWLAAGLLGGWPLLARGQKKEVWLLLSLPLLALALYAWAQSATVSFDPFESRLFALKAGAIAAAVAILTSCAVGERRLRAIVFSVIFVALASSAFGIARQATERNAAWFLLPGLPPGAGYAQFINKNHFALLAEMALGLLAGLALTAWSSPHRQRALVYAALGLPIWAALVLSNSRGGVLALLCEAVFLCATYGAAPRARQPLIGRDDGGWTRTRARQLAARLAIMSALVVALVVGAVWLGGEPVAEHLEATRSEVSAGAADASGASRAEIWRATWAMFRDNPVFGVGLGAYWVAVPHYHRASGATVPQQAHNDYLELLSSGGVAGFALLPAFAFLLVRRARARLGQGSAFGRAASWGALAGLTGVAAHSLVDFGLHITSNALAAAALVAIAAAHSDEQQQDGLPGR